MKSFGFFLGFLLVLAMALPSQAAWLVKQTESGKKISIIDVFHLPEKKIKEERIEIRNLPELLAEEDLGLGESYYQEYLIREDALPKMYQRVWEKGLDQEAVKWPESEVRDLVVSGSESNRIDLTIVGDGYTISEKSKFFEDAERIKDDLFGETTFASYLPLFNVRAVFVPSNESGLTDILRKDTALGLYRSPRGSKRGILPGNRSAIERALKLAPRADYPILIANDDYYGGLGGRYAITTRSHNSGSMVLRHELGHNFGNVGEEYDGGGVYSGANFSRSANVPWKHWIDGDVEVFESKMLAGAYIWENLQGSPQKVRFQFPNPTMEYNFLLYTTISSVGWSSPEDVLVSLDGRQVDYKGVFTSDRSFFRFSNPIPMTPGSHELGVRENLMDGDNVLAFAMLWALPENIRMEDHFVGAYATFNSSRRKVGYRPTFETCLMRDMRSMTFCAIDIENMWIRFLRVVSLLDKVDVDLSSPEAPIATAIGPDIDGLEYTWMKRNENGVYERLEDLVGSSVTLPGSGYYRLIVEFKTPEVRKPSSHFEVTKEFSI